MKKLLLSLFILTVTGINGQELYNRAYHAVNERANSFIVSIDNDLFFNTETYDVQFFGINNLYKHSSSGTLIFKVPVSATYSKVGFKSLDNHLVIASGGAVCDVVPQTQTNYLSKTDATSGLTIFTSTFTVMQGDHPKACLQYSDSTYYTFTDSCLFKHGKTGQFISKTNLGLSEISYALLSPNSTFYISAKQNGSIKFIELSAAGNIVSAVAMPLLFNKLSFYNGGKMLALGTDGKLYKLSSTMTQMPVSSNSNFFISDFAFDQDTIYSICSTSISPSNYMVMDTSLNVILLNTTTTHSITQMAICLNGNRVAVLSNAISKSSYSFPEHYFASLNVFAKAGSNNFKSDLALLSVTPDSVYAQNYASAYCNTYLKARVKIKNVGTTPITEFKLNCFEYPDVACGGNFYQEKFSNLSLLPGDTLTLSATKYAGKRYINYTGSSFTTQYCFYATLPNGETDKTSEDNELCETFDFLLTGLRENALNTMAVTIAPNPFEERFTLSTDAIIKQVELVNSIGALIFNQSANDKQVVLYPPELEPGIYFIKIYTEKGNAIRKIIKY